MWTRRGYLDCLFEDVQKYVAVERRDRSHDGELFNNVRRETSYSTWQNRTHFSTVERCESTGLVRL